MSKKPQKLLFFKKSDSTFVIKDELFLKEHYEVASFSVNEASGVNLLFVLLKQFFFLLKEIKETKIIFIWFGDYHSFFPTLMAKVFGKKSFLVIGGFDTTYIPEVNYGAFSNPIRSFMVRYSIENSKVLLPVDYSLINRAKSFVKEIKGEIIELPTGYDPQKWYCDTPKENIIITVASFNTMRRIKIKGIDFFVEVARAMPYCRFQIIGARKQGIKLLGEIPPNLEIIPPLEQPEIRKHLSKAKVYAQFSMSEGLPNAVCEAMLCECIPIGTDVGGIKKLIEDVGGKILEIRSLKIAIEYINNLIQQKTEKYIRNKIRNKIKSNYVNTKREFLLLKAINEP